ncbi:GntR family transcriptional regulator [Kitasatospora indigofera]|uniref:GntR family transcriptional regulator n=1 Tax=Kitasatospora indigofera TaxID=67307 RepID=UPI00368D154F
MQPKWEQLAGRLQAQIEDGTYPPGTSLPPMDELVEAGEGARATVHQAYRALETAGYVVMIRKRGTVVRDRTQIAVPLSRYGQVLGPGGSHGPWETAAREQGLDGSMIATGAETAEAPAEVATALGLVPGSLAVRRSRSALLGDDVVQVQHAWYPPDIAEAAGLTTPGKIVGGVYGALAAAGFMPDEFDEVVTARLPSKGEAAQLSIGTVIPVLLVERVTRDGNGRVLELLQIIGSADRLKLVYDNLSLRGTAS